MFTRPLICHSERSEESLLAAVHFGYKCFHSEGARFAIFFSALHDIRLRAHYQRATLMLLAGAGFAPGLSHQISPPATTKPIEIS